jgi:hypothetical protein
MKIGHSVEIKHVLSEFVSNPPAAARDIFDFEKTSGIRLPDDYARFLQIANGGEGFIGSNAYVMLWKVDELKRLNEAYEAQKYAPGLLLFGPDGGGEAFAFDMRSEPAPIVSVPFVGMSLDVAQHLASSFESFLENQFKS